MIDFGFEIIEVSSSGLMNSVGDTTPFYDYLTGIFFTHLYNVLII